MKMTLWDPLKIVVSEKRKTEKRFVGQVSFLLEIENYTSKITEKKSNLQMRDVYSELSQTSKLEPFCENK